ncbi:hypothetical protein QE152_g29008 [Popillia japonica]|uniref:Uncharacterized protein n=1 Tax=Popillia japonica TaxID=7064 RepID=A0AAW1JJG2_POPJA
MARPSIVTAPELALCIPDVFKGFAGSDAWPVRQLSPLRNLHCAFAAGNERPGVRNSNNPPSLRSPATTAKQETEMRRTKTVEMRSER